MHPDTGYHVTITVGMQGRAAIACSQECSVESIAEKLGVAIESVEAGPAVPVLYPAEYGTDVLPIDLRGTKDSCAPRPYRLYSAAELDDLPAATWVVEGAIPEN